MRRLAAAAGLSVAALLFTPSTPATACDPNRPPFCQTPCTLAKTAYTQAYYRTGGSAGPLESWYELDLMSC